MDCSPPAEISQGPPIAEAECLCADGAFVELLREVHGLLGGYLSGLRQVWVVLHNGAVADHEDVIERGAGVGGVGDSNPKVGICDEPAGLGVFGEGR